MSASADRTPFLTVLMPIYNAHTYLRQAIDSVLAQSCADFELLCINDGSTDDSAEIVRGYMEVDARVRMLSKANSGYGDSMNQGIAQARGAYIGILEPDDFYEPGALALLVQAAREHRADIVKANYWFYWSTPQERNQLISVVKPVTAGHVFSARQEPSILTSIPSIWSAVYRKAFLQKEGVHFLTTPGASFQDMGFSFKAFASAGRIFCLEDAVLHYRQDNESSSVNNPAKAFCVCDEFSGIDAFIQEKPDRAWLKPYAYRLRYDSYIWNYSRLAPALRKDFFSRMVGDLRTGSDAGAFHPDLFNDYQVQNLRYLLHDPDGFERNYPVNPTPAAKARYYLKIGGPKALISALKK